MNYAGALSLTGYAVYKIFTLSSENLRMTQSIQIWMGGKIPQLLPVFWDQILKVTRGSGRLEAGLMLA